jgi:hypothetical protein
VEHAPKIDHRLQESGTQFPLPSYPRCSRLTALPLTFAALLEMVGYNGSNQGHEKTRESTTP